MKSRTLMCITAMTLLAALALPGQVAAPEQTPTHSYVFTQLPTLGGPNVSGNQTSAKDDTLNSAGTFTGSADTLIIDPYCPLNPDCFAFHAFTFKLGVLTDLGVLPGGFNSEAFWINASGMAAGFSEIGVLDPLIPNFLEFRAVVWKHGKMTRIGTFGGNDSMAQAINNRGQVVGFALNAIPDHIAPQPLPTEMRAFLWENGVMRNLGTLGGPDSWGMFVNDRGQVAGISYPDSSTPNSPCPVGPGNVRTFLWQKGKMIDIGSFGGTCTWPEGLSNQGRIVGMSNLAGDAVTHAFLWDNGSFKDLGTLGGSFGIATWVNDNGEVIGAANTKGDETFLGFAWKHGVMIPLEPLPGDCFSAAHRNNSKGQIIGISISCDFSTSEGVLWENGSVTDLNTFVTPDSALHITGDLSFLNDRGEIAGNGVLPNGDIRFFTLTPVSGCGSAGETSVTRNTDNSSRHVPHGRMTPEMLAKLRALVTPHPRIPGLPTPQE